MSRQSVNEPDLSFRDLLSDPMIRTIMQADRIDERELYELCERSAAELRKREMAGTQADPEDSKEAAFRRGVGIVLLNREGRVFMGQRIDMSGDAWQMPQGGIEDGESPRAAALRELREELGTSNVDIVAEAEGWLHYELPAELLDRLPGVRWRGQRQKWFVMRFLGVDAGINVATEHPEFSKWRWVNADQLVALIVPFKRELYEQVLRQLGRYITPRPGRPSP
jgi:putative (di)nucleoside polyphosphate hydrolase